MRTGRWRTCGRPAVARVRLEKKVAHYQRSRTWPAPSRLRRKMDVQCRHWQAALTRVQRAVDAAYLECQEQREGPSGAVRTLVEALLP